MQSRALQWVLATTVLLVLLALMAVLNLPFHWVFYVTVIGQAMVIYMVFKVLSDPYTTHKTFKDFYEDHPMDAEE